MFKIMLNGRRFNNKAFSTYEKARSYVRKWLRKNAASLVCGSKYSNPAINKFGFKIAAI